MTFSSLIDACTAGMVLNGVPFRSLVGTCTTHGGNNYAEETFENMHPADADPNVPHVVTFNSLDIKKAEEEFPAGAFSSLTDRCAKHSEATRTVQIFETMRTAGVVPYVSLISKAAVRRTLIVAAVERCPHAGSGKGRCTGPAKASG